MKTRVVGTLAVLGGIGLWVLTFVLANLWMNHLRVVNDDPWGYFEIGMLPILVPSGIGVVWFVVWLWLSGAGPLGRIIIDWLAKE